MDDVRTLIPGYKHDHETADAAIAAGYPAVEPILFELLEWIQDMNWPIAQKLAPFLASIGPPLAPHIREIFKTDDEVWKRWVILDILEHSPELTKALRDELEQIATSPTEDEADDELDIEARRLLSKLGS